MPKVKDLSTLVLDDQKNEQHSQSDRRHGEEIDRNDLPDVILQECSPSL